MIRYSQMCWDDVTDTLMVMETLVNKGILSHKDAKEIVLKICNWYVKDNNYPIKSN